MWSSNSMTFGQSFMTFLMGFSIVFICLIAIALFIIISSKVIGSIVKEEPAQAKAAPVQASAKPVVATPAANESEMENLAVIIAAISEEMREPVEKFQIISVKEI